jgi:hypothetical protein
VIYVIIAVAMTDYILFHHFKHHLNFIKDWVDKNQGILNDETIATIKTLGSSQLDMYCGSLSIGEILQQVSDHLQQESITNVELYKQWVGDYKTCFLSDSSSFTLRYINHSKPIHIHPARHVPHSMRVKANSLKSVVCYLIVSGDGNGLNVTMLNAIRKEYLGLSPIAQKLGIDELERVWRTLVNA